MILGGKKEFFMHFCTFFTFDTCLTHFEQKVFSDAGKFFNNPDAVDQKIDSFFNSFDSKQ